MTEGSERLPDVRSTPVELETRPGATALERLTDVPAPHVARFQFLRGALAAVALFAVGAVALLLLSDHGPGSGADDWSRWAPTEQGAAGAAQIAAHVKGQYRLDSGEQIVDVQAGPLQVGEFELTIAIRRPPEQGGSIEIRDGEALGYRLCGMGENCSIPSGEPSEARHLLLRREALELALYSFRYLEDVEDVVVFMPPPKGQAPSQALLFRRPHFQPLLERPLAATLAASTPTVSSVASAPDAELVERLTLPNLFQWSLTQGNVEQRVFLVLAPPRPQSRGPDGAGRSSRRE